MLSSANEAENPLEIATQSNDLFRLLVESVKEYAIFVLDPKGHVATWNAGARAIKGYEASETSISRSFIAQRRWKAVGPRVNFCSPKKKAASLTKAGA